MVIVIVIVIVLIKVERPYDTDTLEHRGAVNGRRKKYKHECEWRYTDMYEQKKEQTEPRTGTTWKQPTESGERKEPRTGTT